MATKGGREKIKLESIGRHRSLLHHGQEQEDDAREARIHEVRPEGTQARALQGNEAEVDDARTGSPRANPSTCSGPLRGPFLVRSRVTRLRRAQLQRELLQRRDAAAPRPACTRPADRPPIARPTRWCASTADAVPRASPPAWPASGCRRPPGQLRLHGLAESCRRRGAASAWPGACSASARCPGAPCAFSVSSSAPHGALQLAGVLGHDLVAIGDQRLQRLAVGHGRTAPSFSCGGVLRTLAKPSISQQRGCRPSRCRTRTA